MGQDGSDKVKILCVDDEENIIQSLKRFLRVSGYDVFSALSGQEGLDFLREHAVDLVIVDQRMPEMTGSEFLRSVRKEFPGTVSVMLSGQSDFESLVMAINEGEVFRFVSKPWDNEALLKVIEAAVARRKVFFLAQKILDGTKSISTGSGDVHVQMHQDDQGIHVRILDKDIVFSRERIFDVLSGVLGSLGIGPNEQAEVLSGALTKMKDKLLLSVEVTGGVVLNIEIPEEGSV